MKLITLTALFLFVLTNASCAPMPDNVARPADTSQVEQFEVKPEPRVKLVAGAATERELFPLRTASWAPQFDGEDFPQYRGLHGIAGITSGGPSTMTGTPLPPVRFATIVAQPSGKRMNLYVGIAVIREGITRSSIGWGGDFIPGVLARGRMYFRRGGHAGSLDEVTAELNLKLPGQEHVTFLFIGYDAEGRLVDPFGRPMEEYVRSLEDPERRRQK